MAITVEPLSHSLGMRGIEDDLLLFQAAQIVESKTLPDSLDEIRDCVEKLAEAIGRGLQIKTAAVLRWADNLYKTAGQKLSSSVNDSQRMIESQKRALAAFLQGVVYMRLKEVHNAVILGFDRACRDPHVAEWIEALAKQIEPLTEADKLFRTALANGLFCNASNDRKKKQALSLMATSYSELCHRVMLNGYDFIPVFKAIKKAESHTSERVPVLQSL